MVTSNSTKILIPCREVLYLERVQRKTHIVTSRETIETYQSPQEILATVKSADFVQCHRSIYINLKKVTRMLPGEFMLEQKISVPIGRQYAVPAKEAFMKFVRGLYLRNKAL
jgi:DNA-binding LytR/AlgR family response regulator